MASTLTPNPPYPAPLTRPKAAPNPNRRWVIGLLALALALRLIYGLAQDPLAPYADAGGDSLWYLANGYSLVTGLQPPSIVTDVSSLGVPPVYPVFLGVWQAILPQAAAVIVVRILQAILAVATCYYAYRLAVRVTHDQRAGLIALGVLAVSPAFILESAQITTETLFIFLLAAGLYAYVRLMDSEDDTADPSRVWPGLALAGVLLGLATLTRAVLLLFPLGLAIHLVLAYGWRRGLRRAAWLLLVYSLVVSTWTVYNLARWNRFIIAGEGFAAFLYVGATGWDGPEAVDERLESVTGELAEDSADSLARQDAYTEAAAATITSDPVGYVQRRVREVVGAYLQPYGTAFFPGESLRDMAAAWARDDRSLNGLLAIARGDQFWPKLAVYAFHYAGFIFGLAGMWLYRRRWRVTLPLIGYILYTTLVHLALLALPRYIFPTDLVWWVFASGAISRLLSAVSRQQKTVRLNTGNQRTRETEELFL